MGIPDSEFHEHARAARTTGTAFALEGVKVLTILNGGALAAIPIATEAFKAVEIPFPALVAGGIIFASGLLLVFLVCLFAYFTENCAVMAYHCYAIGDTEGGDKYQAKHRWFQWPAIGFALLSWAAFVTGCLVLFLSAQEILIIELHGGARKF